MTYANIRRDFTQIENQSVIKNSVIPNLIWNLQRLSLRLINYVRGRSRIKYGMTFSFNNGGFTLIELLVIVLIIGILAAVALPQYQTAVDKTRVMPYIKLAWEIKRAEEVFYLTNGSYTRSLEDLDVNYRNGCKLLPKKAHVNLIPCPTHILIDIATTNNQPTGSIAVHYCPHTKNWESFTCESESIFAYRIAFDHGGKNYISNCTKKNDSSRGERLCNAIQH